MWCTCLLIYQVQNGTFKSTYSENGESSYHIEIDIKPCVVSFLPLINYWLSLCYYCSPPVSFFQNYLAEKKQQQQPKQKRLSSHANTQPPVTLALKMSFRETENCLSLKLDHSVTRFLWIVAHGALERVRQTNKGEVMHLPCSLVFNMLITTTIMRDCEQCRISDRSLKCSHNRDLSDTSKRNKFMLFSLSCQIELKEAMSRYLLLC